MRIIAGVWGGRRIEAPGGTRTRPTTDRTREAWMSAMAPSIPGARVLDLFAGSGALGLECLSRGAQEVTFVERSRTVLRTLRANVASLGAQDRVTIVAADALRWIGRLPPSGPDGAPPFDLAVADPPYGQGLAPRLAGAFRQRPFARELWVEHDRRESLDRFDPLRERRYGDTFISALGAVLPDEPDEPAPEAPLHPSPRPGDPE